MPQQEKCKNYFTCIKALWKVYVHLHAIQQTMVLAIAFVVSQHDQHDIVDGNW